MITKAGWITRGYFAEAVTLSIKIFYYEDPVGTSTKGELQLYDAAFYLSMIAAIEIAVLVLVEMHATVNALIKNKMFLVCFIGCLLAIVGLNLYSTIEVEKELFDEIDKFHWKEICDNGNPDFSYFGCFSLRRQQ